MKKIMSFALALLMLLSCASVAFAAETQTTPFENSSFFSSGDYTLHYRTFEPQTKEKNQIMLLHGFGLSTVSLEGLAEEYVNYGYKVVLVDLPNFGYSSRETSKTSLAEREVLVSDLMKSLGGTWVLGGHSMGGGIASNIAIDYPELVSGLLLFAPQTSEELSAPQAAIMSSPLVKVPFEFIVRIASRSESLMRKMVEMSFSDADYAAQYDVSRISDPLKKAGTGAGIAIMASHAKATDLQKFAALNVPIVIVTASNDKVASKNSIDALIDASPEKLSVHTFDCGGHMFMEYMPEETAKVTLTTIEKASAL